MRRITRGFLCVAALVIAIGTLAADKPKDKAKDQETMASLIQKGEYQKVVDLGKAAIAANKVDESVYTSLGVAYFQLKDYPNAIASYEEASKLNPLDSQPLLYEATIYHTMGQDDKAAETFRQVIAIDPANKDVRYNVAQVLEKQGKVDDALVQYEEIFKMDPAFKDVAFAIGLIDYDKEQYGPAEPYFDKALSLQPGDEQILLAQGQNYLKGGKLDQAIPPLKAFLDVTKNENYKPAVTGTVAGLYVKQAEKAMAPVKNSKDKAAIAQAEATAKVSYGNAVVYFDKLLVMRPNSEAALEGKARALIMMDRSQDALPVLKQFMQVSKNEAEKKSVADTIKKIEAQKK